MESSYFYKCNEVECVVFRGTRPRTRSTNNGNSLPSQLKLYRSITSFSPGASLTSSSTYPAASVTNHGVTTAEAQRQSAAKALRYLVTRNSAATITILFAMIMTTRRTCYFSERYALLSRQSEQGPSQNTIARDCAELAFFRQVVRLKLVERKFQKNSAQLCDLRDRVCSRSFGGASSSSSPSS